MHESRGKGEITLILTTMKENAVGKAKLAEGFVSAKSINSTKRHEPL